MIVAYNIATEIADNFTTFTGYTVEPLYGEPGENLQDEVKNGLPSDSDYKLYFKSNVNEEENAFTLASKGVIQSGVGVIALYMLKGFDVVKTLQLFWNAAGYVTELDGIGYPAGAPYVVEDLTVWRFEPLGGIQKTALFFGDFYGIEQLVSYSVALTSDIT
jgi:hypothetical protein